MFRRLTWTTVPLLAIAMAMTTDTSTAKADGFAIQVGRFGFSSYGNGYGRYGGHDYRNFRSPSYRNYYPSDRSYHRGYFNHRRHPHLDWHGPSLVPHGNHLDYVPGHYDVHYGGHH